MNVLLADFAIILNQSNRILTVFHFLFWKQLSRCLGSENAGEATT